MRVHIIIDFMHIYYRYYFTNKIGRLKKLTAPMNLNGTMCEHDVTLIYHSLKTIEGIRSKMEMLGHEVITSICFDSPSKRKNDDEEYKGNRNNKLSDMDFMYISKIREMLESAGHNTYKEDGMEADDLINNIIKKYSSDFDFNIIYTNDKDLLVNISSNVGVMRYKTKEGYVQIDINNYERVLEEEFGAKIPYNTIQLYLSTVGDKSDNIKGINKFGNAAYNKLIKSLIENEEIDWGRCTEVKYMDELIETCGKYLKATQFEELKESYSLVKAREEMGNIAEPTKMSTRELRIDTYKQYNMLSLI